MRATTEWRPGCAEYLSFSTGNALDGGAAMRALPILPLLLVAIAVSADENAMKLVWSDEFERDGLPDPAK